MFKKGTPITAEEVFKSIFDISNKEILAGWDVTMTRGDGFSSATFINEDRRNRKKKVIITSVYYNEKCYKKTTVVEITNLGAAKITTSYSEEDANSELTSYLRDILNNGLPEV